MQLNIMNAQQHGDSPSYPPILQEQTFEVGDLVILNRPNQPPLMVLIMGVSLDVSNKLPFLWGSAYWVTLPGSLEVVSRGQIGLSDAYAQGRLTFVSHPETLAEAKQIIDAFNQITS